MKRAVVYRAFDAEGRLLYVGSSVSLEARLTHHLRFSPWWLSKSYITTTHYSSREAAAIAEFNAIATEHPRWNVVGRSPDHPDGPVSTPIRYTPHLRDEIKAWQDAHRT